MPERASPDAPTPADIAEAIATLLAARAQDATICPSEVARHLRSEDWRPLMDPVRAVAADLARRGQLEVTQGGQAVDVATARGPVRLGRPNPDD